MNLRQHHNHYFVAVGLLVAVTLSPPAVAKSSAKQTARQVDRLLAEEVFTAETELADQ
jgi:hypothetical protein